MTSFFSFFTLSGKNLDMTFKSKKPMRSKLLNSLINLIKEKLLFNFSFGASFKLKELERSMSPHTHVHTCSPTQACPLHTCAHMLTHRGTPPTHLCTHAHPQRHAPPTDTCAHMLTHKVHGSLPGNKMAQLPSRVRRIFSSQWRKKIKSASFLWETDNAKDGI